jgi:hypothetical protein
MHPFRYVSPHLRSGMCRDTFISLGNDGKAWTASADFTAMIVDRDQHVLVLVMTENGKC